MDKLRVAMVARSLNVDHLRGTGRYVQEVMRHVRPEDGVAWHAFAHDPAKPLHLPPGYAGQTEVFDFKGDRLRLWEQLGLPLRLRGRGLQLLHCADNTAPVWQPVPTIVTIHDAVPWTEPMRDGLTHFYMHRVQALAFKRCAAVITISENSRRDIVQRWPEVAHKVVVIPHGIADEFFSSKAEPLPVELEAALRGSPYLMYLGGPQPRKRFDWALKLLARCNRPDVHLVACGFAAGTQPQTLSVPELAGRVHFAPYISDAQLVRLYRGAVGTLYPTLYEGFGFPAVESQAAGTPAVFSPVSSLVDLTGPLSWNPAPEDFEGWLASVNAILALDPQERAHRTQEALEWSRRFSWRASCEGHQRVYEKVLRTAEFAPSHHPTEW